MKETMTISKLISEEKKLLNIMNGDIEDKTFSTHAYIDSSNEYIGPYTVEQYENLNKANVQKLIDLNNRLVAIRHALTQANNNTIIEVDSIPTLKMVLNNKKPVKEKITIAEAINRKRFCTNLINKVCRPLQYRFNVDVVTKSKVEKEIETRIEKNLAAKFPVDSKNAWSPEKYNEAKLKEQEEHKLKIIDPNKFIETNAISNWVSYLNEYLMNIDTILSEANASTEVEVVF